MKQIPAFSPLLAHFDHNELLASLLALVAGSPVYCVDKGQHILYWSEAMAQLTGLPACDVVAKRCAPEYAITTEEDGQVLSLINKDGQTVCLKKSVQMVYDQYGAVSGGLGLLNACGQALAKEAVPSIQKTTKQNFYGIISRSPAMQAVFQIIENAAETTATVLVRGESGAGKELVARAIHQLSARRNAPFLAINCAALSSSLLESELFGHVRGAFTGAVKDHHGMFQRAHGGTLFLDEVAELPLDLQAKLLRVIQERNFIPVGGDRSVSVDVRLVAASHRSLREQVKKGEFREDLMYRLRVVPIFLPPLRERREDISLLLWHFIQVHNGENLRKIDKIDPLAMRLLLDYAWPGNVRELHNVIEYAFAVGRGSILKVAELPPEFREPTSTESPAIAPLTNKLRLSAEEEAVAIRQALQQSNGSLGHAGDLLGMSRATLWRKRKRYGL
ncbi:sigma-54 interaction domain-containing protein [Methylovulum psychrotolerans]|jgi:transcriptional regulator with PAS, ATPase and Fis domain|uniref:Sigma-54-dependent Fis family transcriptional regulator n=1 Tax=Methylovulum psychrotolerans TaxID=1704499 RepID=A0A1Z4C0H3_9GAMM|nr:sigma-54 dependent transcriptional regulator [Methylovulum psychrotolerans]ASF47044.1 sigma-54-dependent Fis family transcriptional regulator [Methylovulum psychrotolerans]